eukprot:COSAG04_NODE_431_length_14522_cov_23.420717_5_plen_103_part_00
MNAAAAVVQSTADRMMAPRDQPWVRFSCLLTRLSLFMWPLTRFLFGTGFGIGQQPPWGACPGRAACRGGTAAAPGAAQSLTTPGICLPLEERVDDGRFRLLV